MRYVVCGAIACGALVLCYSYAHHVNVSGYVRLKSDLLASSAGVYKKQYYPKYTKDVVVMVANYGVLDFIVNWLCSYDTSNVRFVVVSLDKELHDHLQMHTRITSIDGSRFNASASHGVSNFMTSNFNLISHDS